MTPVQNSLCLPWYLGPGGDWAQRPWRHRTWPGPTWRCPFCLWQLPRLWCHRSGGEPPIDLSLSGVLQGFSHSCRCRSLDKIRPGRRARPTLCQSQPPEWTIGCLEHQRSWSEHLATSNLQRLFRSSTPAVVLLRLYQAPAEASRILSSCTSLLDPEACSPHFSWFFPSSTASDHKSMTFLPSMVQWKPPGTLWWNLWLDPAGYPDLHKASSPSGESDGTTGASSPRSWLWSGPACSSKANSFHRSLFWSSCGRHSWSWCWA